MENSLNSGAKDIKSYFKCKKGDEETRGQGDQGMNTARHAGRGAAEIRHSERGVAESKNLMLIADNYCVTHGILRLGYASL